MTVDKSSWKSGRHPKGPRRAVREGLGVSGQVCKGHSVLAAHKANQGLAAKIS